LLDKNENGRLSSTDDLWKLIFFDRVTQKYQTTCLFTQLANHSKSVRYAGEFHLRPRFGWNRINDQWEIVFDNASGTYSQNGALFVNLKKLLLFNFPELNIITYDYKDPMLKKSLEQLQFATKKYKHSTTINKSDLSCSSSN
jgi:hypothetical protein